MKRSSVVALVLLLVVLLATVATLRRADNPDAMTPAGVSRFAPAAPGLQDGSSDEPVVDEDLPAEAVSPEGASGPQVILSLQNDTSAALRDIAVIPPQQERPDPDLNDLRPLPGRENKPEGPTDFVDPVLQEGELPAAMPAPIANFDGVNNVNGVLPPDTNGDVGPNHYVQWVNLSFAIYSKTGTLLYGPAAGNTLWSGFGGPCQTTNNGDPIAQYDHLADRWMVSQFALPNYPSGPYYQCIAVSQTPDPTGAWYRYAFQISATKMNDYPHFGVWPDGYYMTINQFTNASSWGGAGVVAFERSKMLAGQPAQAVYFDLYSVNPNLGGMLPADLDGPAPPAGTPNYVMEADDNAYGFPQDQLQIYAFQVNWSNPAASTFTLNKVLATAAFDSNMCGGSRNCIPQSGTTRKLDAIADRLMYRLQYRNFGSYQTLVANHTVDANSSDRAGIRWYELRNAGSGWSIYQQGTFSPDATGRWMASAAMDGSGNLAVGYSASSSSIFPAIRYSGRLAGDPLGSLPQGEGTLINGTGAQTHSASRWGDYSMLAVDPVDNCTFWFTSEYIQTTGSAPWRTRIGSFKFPSCGGAPTTGTLQGTVRDASNNSPLAGANVAIAGGSSTTTDASGSYQFFSLAAGSYNVTASKSGYDPATVTGVNVTAGSTTVQDFALAPVTVSGDTIYVSSTSNGTAGGVAFADEDILAYNTATGTWSLYFDGSDVGVTGDVDAFALLADGSLLLSFDNKISISGLGSVADADIVRFIPGTPGPNTSGTFEWYFDGSDVGLTTSNEDIDALDLLSDGRLIVSTTGSYSVPGLSGDDKDLLAFTPTSLGSDTSGTWDLYFDGSDVGLTNSSEDVNATWIDPDGKIYLSTTGNFSVTGASGDGSDIFVCTPGSLGTNTMCTFAPYWDGSANGFKGEVTDALEIMR